MRIEIKAQDDSGLSQEVFIFEVAMPLGYGSIAVRFTDYYRQHRKTKRYRNWNTSAFWSRRPDGGGMYSCLSIEKPRVPSAVEVDLRCQLSVLIKYDL